MKLGLSGSGIHYLTLINIYDGFRTLAMAEISCDRGTMTMLLNLG